MISEKNKRAERGLASEASVAGFKVLLAYPDIAHERLGRKYCERLSESLPMLGQAIFSEWKFEMLAAPSMSAMAADEARNVSLVLVAAEGGQELPAGVKAWFENWCIPRKACDSVMVILLSETPSTGAARWPDQDYFETRTRDGGVVLVVYATGLAPDETDGFTLTEARRVTADGLSMVEDLPEAAALKRPAASSSPGSKRKPRAGGKA